VSESISHEEFVQGVSESEIVSGADLRAAIEGMRDEGAVADAGALARSLMRGGQLTRFQADAILAGRLSELCIGNYIVLDRLGAGGMGTVYKARHRRMKRVVALKFLPRETAGQSSFAERFQREVETIAQLSHANIVMAFDADEAPRGLFLVMEFVDGRDLGSEVTEEGPLSVADGVDCIVQAARGLAYAHHHGVVHRDVKPANLLRDTSGVVKVADLGLARLTAESSRPESSLTQAGSILGTADYIAPEQALDSTKIDHRVDIYSLGCTLYFLLAGRPLYSAGSLMALLLKHRDAPIPALCEARRDVPEVLDAIYQRMAAKRPEDRYLTMDEVVQALEAVNDTGTLSSARPTARGPEPSSGSAANATMLADPMRPAESVDFRLGVPAPAAASGPSPSEVRRVADLKVVLVEPSRAQASIVRQYLRKLGIDNVRVTGSGKAVLEMARQKGTDVILSSMHLADMTGVQLAQALHDDPGCADVGFVLASSESDGGEVTKALSLPLTVLLPKPFDLRGLAQALAQATGRVIEEIRG
jgi:serine/threonine protein kinase/CheY-like chemotaxis protein